MIQSLKRQAFFKMFAQSAEFFGSIYRSRLVCFQSSFAACQMQLSLLIALLQQL